MLQANQTEDLGLRHERASFSPIAITLSKPCLENVNKGGREGGMERGMVDGGRERGRDEMRDGGRESGRDGMREGGME